MNFEKCRREFDHMDESEIFPNRHIFVSIVGQEIEEKVPLKLVILTPPAKIVHNCLPLGFHRQSFLRTHPWHHQQTEKQKNCQSKQDVDQVLYSAMDGRQCENKQHGDTAPEKARGMFLCYLKINIKKCVRCGSVLWDTCVLLKLELFSTQL